MFKPTIVVVAYNRENSLKRLLNSLAKANYQNKVNLIISIDYGDSRGVINIAKEFNWEFGKKEVHSHEKHLGLKKHILHCGDLAEIYNSVIVLEDDIFVSPFFYLYTSEAVKFYHNDPNIGGVSLYSHKFNETNFTNFIPLSDESDVFFLQLASSWGQCWTSAQWKQFKEWYIKKGKNTDFKMENLPGDILAWPESSWKKYFIKYLIETNKYFVYPRESFTTNFAEKGVHYYTNQFHFQVALQLFKKNYIFKNLDDSISVYDSFCEINAQKLKQISPHLADYDFEVDLNGQKKLEFIESNYLLTSKQVESRIKSYALLLKPPELNIIYELDGNDIFLAKKSKCTVNATIPQKYKYCYYNNIPEEIFNKFEMDITNCNKQILRYKELFEQNERQLKKIKKSTSWKLTIPLRLIKTLSMQLFKKIKWLYKKD
jgi:hypothetical protein